MSSFFQSEMSESRIESLQTIKKGYIQNEAAQLRERVGDLQMNLSINKDIIRELLQDNHQHAMLKLEIENTELADLNKRLIRERDDAQARQLIMEQISEELQAKEDELANNLEEQVKELKEKLERKEYFMQSKEKKWLEVEKLLAVYTKDDLELKKTLADMRVRVESTKKITNVIEDNE